MSHNNIYAGYFIKDSTSDIGLRAILGDSEGIICND